MAQHFEGGDGSVTVEDDGTVVLAFSGLLAHADKKKVSPVRIPASEIVGAEVVPARGLTMAHLRLHRVGPQASVRYSPTKDPHTLLLAKPAQVEAVAPLVDWLTGRSAALVSQASREPGGQRADVKAARDAMVTKFGARRELRHLAGHLLPGESVEHACRGRYAGRMGVVVLTDQRLLFLFEGVLRRQTEDLPLNSISSVHLRTGLVMSKVEVTASGTRSTIDQMQKLDAEPLAARLRQRIAQRGTLGTAGMHRAPAPAPAASVDVGEQLGRLADLRDRGVLTEEEFTAQKRKVLGG